MFYKKEQIIALLKETPEILIAVDIKGDIKKCISFFRPVSKISLKEFYKIIRKETAKGLAVGFLQQDVNMNKEKLEQKIKELVGALKYSKTHKLQPGVNVPGNGKYLAIKNKLASKLKKHP